MDYAVTDTTQQVSGWLGFVQNWTAEGVLGLVIILIIFGLLVPARIVKARMADKDQMIAEAQRYARVLEANNELLRRGGYSTVQVLDALPPAIQAAANAPTEGADDG
jgi:hypothetical protein